MCICVQVVYYTYMYVYIYRERERQRGREIFRDICSYTFTLYDSLIYIKLLQVTLKENRTRIN